MPRAAYLQYRKVRNCSPDEICRIVNGLAISCKGAKNKSLIQREAISLIQLLAAENERLKEDLADECSKEYYQ